MTFRACRKIQKDLSASTLDEDVNGTVYKRKLDDQRTMGLIREYAASVIAESELPRSNRPLDEEISKEAEDNAYRKGEELYEEYETRRKAATFGSYPRISKLKTIEDYVEKEKEKIRKKDKAFGEYDWASTFPDWSHT